MVVTTIDSNGSKIFIEINLTNGVQSNSISPVATPTRPLTPVNKSTDQIETVMPSTAEPIEATVEVNISESNNIQHLEPIAVSTTTVYIEEQTMISNEQISMTISEKIETDEAIVTDTIVETVSVVEENDVTIELAEPEPDQITE